MARKFQNKRSDASGLATPTNDNNLLAYGALFKVSASGNIIEDGTSAFLLNPDTIEDTKSSNWIENNIPGQSDPIIQWASGGPRNLNFTALVTQDTAHFKNPKKNDLLGSAVDTALTAVGSIASSFAGINIPPVGSAISSLLGNESGAIGEELGIEMYLNYYRSLMYPEIDENGVLTSSPPLVVLALGKTLTAVREANVTGKISPGKYGSPGGTDLWVAKNISIKITKWLPNLTPMEAEVSFQFTQYTMQSRSAGSLGFSNIDSSVKSSISLPASVSNPLTDILGF